MAYLHMEQKLIYKYRHFDEHGYHLRLLSHGELYFASPSEFNDPFDCSLPLRLDLLTPEQALPLFTDQVKREQPGVSDDEAQRTALEFLEGREYSLSEMQALTEYGREIMDARFRVCALSANEGNILMWSHYADQHRGFCVGFDSDKLADSLGIGVRVNGFYVEYADPMPALSPAEVPPAEFVQRSLRTKYDLWSYEEEYRFYSSSDVPPVHVLPPGVVTEVTMGCEIQLADRVLLMDALRARGDSEVRLYQATKQVEQFSLTRHSVDYQQAI